MERTQRVRLKRKPPTVVVPCLIPCISRTAKFVLAPNPPPPRTSSLGVLRRDLPRALVVSSGGGLAAMDPASRRDRSGSGALVSGAEGPLASICLRLVLIFRC